MTTSQPLRVLQISAFYAAHGGGIERVASHLALELTRQGYSVTWMAGGPLAEHPKSDELPGVRLCPASGIDPLEHLVGLPAPLWSLTSLLQLAREIRRAEVIHVHDYLYLANVLAIVLARLHHKPVLITQHIGEIPFKSRLLRLLLESINSSLGLLALRACQSVVFIAAPVRRYFQQRSNHLSTAQLIPNGVDHETFFPRFDALAPSPPWRVLFVGRYVEKKGVALLRTAVTHIPDVEWNFVGSGPVSPAQWTFPTDSAPVLKLHERLTPQELAHLYRQADLLVLPSTGEGFPLVVQEALACGTPVLVSQEVAEAFQAIDDRCVSGVELRGLTADQAASALEQALRQRLTPPLRLVDTRQAACQLAQHWSWSGCAQGYAECYQILSRPMNSDHTPSPT